MVRRALIVALVLAALPLAAREAPGALRPDGDPAARNPLEGYSVALELPALRLTVDGDEVRGEWVGEARLLLDGRAAALFDLPAARATLPPRRWTARDWLRAGLIGLGAVVVGGAAGYLAGALR